MQTAFLEAVVNRQHTVLGRRLHDLCLYDVLALIAAENPLWIGGTVGMEHLQQAALICSLEPGRFLTAQLAPQNRWEHFARALWKNQNRRREARGEFPAELAHWDAYVADFNALPEYWDGEDGKSFKAPWLFSMATFIEMHSNLLEREILTAPLGKMFWKSATIAERLGVAAADMMTQDEIEIGAEQAAAVADEAIAQQVPPPGTAFMLPLLV